MKRLAIIGASGLGRLIAHHATSDKHYVVAGFFDDAIAAGTIVEGYPVLGSTGDVVAVHAAGRFDEVMIGLGYKQMPARRTLFERCVAAGIPQGRVVHSSAYIDPSCRIDPGCVVLPGCVLDRNVVLNANVLLNTACAIAHDSEVKQHTWLSPRVAVSGCVTIGAGCIIGVNTTIVDTLAIADGVQTGGGTVVIKALERPGLYVGNPARFVR